MVYKVFDSRKAGSYTSVNEKLAEELHKPVTKKFKRRKVLARFKTKFWVANFTEKGSLSSKNKNVKYLLCIIGAFSKYHGLNIPKIKKVKQFLMLLSNY